MVKIADKHGLTNPYREFGRKRLVKRGRRRKYLLGAPKKRKNSSYKSTKKKTVQKQIVNHEHVHCPENRYKEDIEKIVKTCPNCGSRYIEKTGSVFVCGNCRATYRAIDDLVDTKIQSIFEQKFELPEKKKWWEFWK